MGETYLGYTTFQRQSTHSLRLVDAMDLHIERHAHEDIHPCLLPSLREEQAFSDSRLRCYSVRPVMVDHIFASCNGAMRAAESLLGYPSETGGREVYTSESDEEHAVRARNLQFSF